VPAAPEFICSFRATTIKSQKPALEKLKSQLKFILTWTRPKEEEITFSLKKQNSYAEPRPENSHTT
jgi:hypothetical protein